jgi:predicted acyl esterase
MITESRAQREEIQQLRQELKEMRADNKKQLAAAHKMLAEAHEPFAWYVRQKKERATRRLPAPLLLIVGWKRSKE